MKKQTIETNLLLNLSIYAPKWWDFNLPSTSQKINAAINAEQNTIGNFGKETKENDLLNQSLNTGDRQTVICKFIKLKKQSEYSLTNELKLQEFLCSHKMSESDFLLAISISFSILALVTFLLAISINDQLSNFIGNSVESYSDDLISQEYQSAQDTLIESLDDRFCSTVSVKTINGFNVLMDCKKNRLFVQVKCKLEITGDRTLDVSRCLNKAIKMQNKRIEKNYNLKSTNKSVA